MALDATLGSTSHRPKVLENLLDHFLTLDEADDPYGPPAFGTNQRIDIVDLLDKPGPILQVRKLTTKRGTTGRLVGTTHKAVVLTLPSVQKGTGFPGKPFFPGAPEKVLEGFVTGRSSRFFSAYTTERNAVTFSCNSP